MKNNFTALLLGALLFSFGCSPIVEKASVPVFISSNPSEPHIVITDKQGVEMYRGNTPATMEFKAGSVLFSRAPYQLTFEKKGDATKTFPLEFKSDGWYFGNTLFGDVVGMLIIDHHTGAIYKLDTEFTAENLIIATTSTENEELKVFGLNEIPLEWKKHLVSLD